MQKKSNLERALASLSSMEIYMSESDLNHQRLIGGGLVTFSLIIVQAFIATGLTDPASYICVFAFALALPLMVLFVFYFGTLKLLTSTKVPGSVGVLYIGGGTLDICGIAAAFWHISWIAGVLFIFSGSVAILVYSTNTLRVELQHKNPLSNLE
jgi:hypothetical protein